MGGRLRISMKWEYAALELISGYTENSQNHPWPRYHGSHKGEWWVLRSDRSWNKLKITIVKSTGKVKSWEGALYANKDPFLLFMEAAADGWEMTSSIPVSFRMHFDTGAHLGGYNMMPMMRRRLQE